MPNHAWKTRAHSFLFIPRVQLARESRIIDLDGRARHLIDLDDDTVDELGATLRRLTSRWLTTRRFVAFMVIAIDDLRESRRFRLHAVPYPRASTDLVNAWRQLSVLARVSFARRRAFLAKAPDFLAADVEPFASGAAFASRSLSQACSGEADDDCPFCRRAVVESQVVLEGTTALVLFNYAPIGARGERLHFLVIPKAHRPGFLDLTDEEHREAYALARHVAQRLSEHFRDAPLHRLYTYHKTGAEAGQSVRHWHLHLVFFQSDIHDVWGRVGVLLKVLAPPSLTVKLTPRELAEKQERYRKVLD